MALSENDVRGIADYARIALEGDELAQMTAYMNDAVDILAPILKYADEDVAPTFHPIGDLVNVMRDDAVDAERALPLNAALDNAGSSRDRMFRVPSILGDGAITNGRDPEPGYPFCRADRLRHCRGGVLRCRGGRRRPRCR